MEEYGSSDGPQPISNGYLLAMASNCFGGAEKSFVLKLRSEHFGHRYERSGRTLQVSLRKSFVSILRLRVSPSPL